MKVFVVYCHPSDDSFTKHMCDAFIKGIEDSGNEYMYTGENNVGMLKTPDGRIFCCMKNPLSLDSPLRGASRICVEERRLIRC